MTNTQITVAAGTPEHLSADDIRHKALAIRDMATDEVRETLADNTTRMVIAGAIVVGVALSVAFYLGTRAARAAAPPVRR